MAYRYGTRYQFGLFPQSIEDYVAPSDPVRAYDAFVEGLDFNDLGIEIDPNQVGNSEYDPKAIIPTGPRVPANWSEKPITIFLSSGSWAA
jgi:hypothetical protein